MILHKPLKRIAASLAVLMVVAGCGNDPAARALSPDTLKQIMAKPAPVTPPTQADVARALNGTQGPLELVTRTDNNGWSLMLRIEQNQGYETFGSSDRRSVTMRNGVLTATRGLGGDLMSSDLSGVMPLITARKSGRGARIMRFLDGEDQTVEIRFDCMVTPGQSIPVKAGQLNTTARQVTERCTAGNRTITNTYLVDDYGRSVSAKQWAGATGGYLLFQTMRR
jgi:hypothetical protein